MHDISAKIFKTFISGQKSTSNFKFGGKRKMKKENRKEKEKKSWFQGSSAGQKVPVPVPVVFSVQYPFR